MTRDQVEAGLINGTLERGVSTRYARGSGSPVPTQGALLLPWEVEGVNPPVSGREVVGWLVVGEVSVATAAKMRWSAPVVAVGRRNSQLRGST